MNKLKAFWARHGLFVLIMLMMVLSWMSGFMSGRIDERIRNYEKQVQSRTLTDEQVQILMELAAREANNE
jgi:hypothetical protein